MDQPITEKKGHIKHASSNGARILTVGAALFSVCVCARARTRMGAKIWRGGILISTPFYKLTVF